MSAYLVTNETIDLMLTAGRATGDLLHWDDGASDKHYEIVSRDGSEWQVADRVKAPLMVNYIRHAGHVYGERMTSEDWTLLGTNLLWFNYLSLNHRYGDAMPASGSYSFDPYPGPYPGSWLSRDDLTRRDVASRVLGAIRGYEYQSCEFKGWEQSVACAFTRALTAAVTDVAIGSHGWTVSGRDDLRLGEYEGAL